MPKNPQNSTDLVKRLYCKILNFGTFACWTCRVQCYLLNIHGSLFSWIFWGHKIHEIRDKRKFRVFSIVSPNKCFMQEIFIIKFQHFAHKTIALY